MSRFITVSPYRIRVAGNRQPCKDILAGRLLHLAPLRRSDAHVALERTLERRFRLITRRLHFDREALDGTGPMPENQK